jgi:hypothetical protein
LSNIDINEIGNYKEKGAKGLLTLGSLNLVERMTAMNLIDDYYFCMQPFIAGSGSVRLFDKLKLDKGLSLHYIESVPLESGVNIIHYQPK